MLMSTDVLNLWFCDGFGRPAPSDIAGPSGCNAG
jgi:hypothetical protein